jgi:hypothetical protein
MPSASEILKALALLANKYMVVAIAWHAAFVLFLLLLLFANRKPSNHFAGYFLTLPLFSVSIFAWQMGNLFNGILFLIECVVLVFLTTKNKTDSVGINPNIWLRTIGAIIFLSGLFYPHFLEQNLWMYLYAAPVGLVPCPTLLTITGLVLVFDTRQLKSWFVVLTIVDFFYGVFGVMKLNVYLDLILIAGAIALFLQIILTASFEKRLQYSTIEKHVIT